MFETKKDYNETEMRTLIELLCGSIAIKEQALSSKISLSITFKSSSLLTSNPDIIFCNIRLAYMTIVELFRIVSSLYQAICCNVQNASHLLTFRSCLNVLFQLITIFTKCMNEDNVIKCKPIQATFCQMWRKNQDQGCAILPKN